MPELDFQVESIEPAAMAAAPTLNFNLRITQAAVAGKPVPPIHSIALRCQIRIEPARRRYSQLEQEKLFDLFGEPSQWGQTLRGMLWTNVSIVCPPFADGTLLTLQVPCTYDLIIASTKYFDALAEGGVPLTLLFSGTIFYPGDDRALQVEQISWAKEASCVLPVHVWRRMMDQYYPNSAWLSLRKDLFDRLAHYRSRHGHIDFDEAMQELLDYASEQVAS